MIELKIIMDDGGKIRVTGPLENKHTCYGMLECARDAIKNFADSNKSAIVAAPAGALGDLSLHKS